MGVFPVFGEVVVEGFALKGVLVVRSIGTLGTEAGLGAQNRRWHHVLNVLGLDAQRLVVSQHQIVDVV